MPTAFICLLLLLRLVGEMLSQRRMTQRHYHTNVDFGVRNLESKCFVKVTYDARCVDADAKESLDGLNHGQRGANLLPNLVSKQHMGESSHVFLKLYGDSAIAWH